MDVCLSGLYTIINFFHLPFHQFVCLLPLLLSCCLFGYNFTSIAYPCPLLSIGIHFCLSVYLPLFGYISLSLSMYPSLYWCLAVWLDHNYQLLFALLSDCMCAVTLSVLLPFWLYLNFHLRCLTLSIYLYSCLSVSISAL